MGKIRQLGYKSQEKKNYRLRQDEIYENDSAEIQERLPEWNAEGGKRRVERHRLGGWRKSRSKVDGSLDGVS